MRSAHSKGWTSRCRRSRSARATRCARRARRSQTRRSCSSCQAITRVLARSCCGASSRSIAPRAQLRPYSRSSRWIPSRTVASSAAATAGSTNHAFTILRGKTRVAAGAEVGPHAVAVDAEIGPDANVGPFCYLRPGTKLGPGAKVGSFVEIKNSELGARAKVPHLSYIGDAEIGEDTNVAAGNITANFP